LIISEIAYIVKYCVQKDPVQD